MNASFLGCLHTKLRSTIAGFFILTAFFAALASAQPSGSGTVTGRVTNKAIGDPLWNAVVSVKGTSLATTTERDGSFHLNVPAGAQTLVVTYTGLDALEQRVSVTAGETLAQDLALTSEVYVLDTLTVKTMREGQSLAIQQQRQAPNIKLVTAIDAFGNPAANPGELIQRLAEVSTEIIGSEVRGVFIRGMDPSFSVLQVDGQQMATSRGTGASREFQIEQQGTGNIQSVELIKAPRPEDDANSIAGFVNLITRRAYDSPGRQIKLTVGTMWRSRESDANPFQDNAGLDQYGVSYSDIYSIFGGDKNLGVAFNVSRRVSATTQDEIGAGMTATGPGALWFRDGAAAPPLMRVFGTGDFYYEADAVNAGLNIDFKLGPASYLYLRTSYNTNKQYQRFNRWDILAPTAAYNPANPAAGGFTAASTADFLEVLPSGANSRAASFTALFDKYSKNYSINPGLSVKLFDNSATLDASVFHSYANIKYPDYNTVTSTTAAVTPAGLGWTLDFRGRDVQTPALAQTSGASIYDAASYTPTGNSKVVWWAPSTYQNAKVDFTKDFDLAFPTTVKAGFKYTTNRQEPSRDQEARTWTGGTGIGSYLESSYKQGNGNYGPFPFIKVPGIDYSSKDIMSSANMVITDQNAYSNFISSTSGDGEFEEQLTAFYLQARMKFGALGVLAGVRVEQTENEAVGYIVNNSAAYNFVTGDTLANNLARAGGRFSEGRTTINADYRKTHPGLHLTYEAPRSIILRASYNNTITRPNIPSTVQFGFSFNPDNQTISIGNPGLKPYTSDNYEVSVEKYFEPVGKFSVGAFYKDITDYFTNFTSIVPTGPDNGFGGDFAGYNLTQARNIGDATIQGYSVDYSQQFSFLPGIWKGFGVAANYTKLKSEGAFAPNAAGTARSRTLPGSVPESSNLSVSYMGHGLQLRLMANYRSDFILAIPAEINGTGANDSNTQYRDERVMWDFKSAYTFNKTYELFFDVYNLTNEPTGTVRVAGRETFTLWQGTTFSAGVNARF